MVIIIGHHGTSRENVPKILDSGFKVSIGEEQWFGEGVYFFEDDPVEAKNWAIKIKGFVRNWAVLKARIEANNVLDITKGREWNVFIGIRKRIAEANKEKGHKNKVINDVVAINLMCQQFTRTTGETIDVVKAGLNAPGYQWTDAVTNIPRMQYQVCVKNVDCISDVVEEAV